MRKTVASPQLSIIISLRQTQTCHRDTKRLDDCLASLDAQTAKDFEVIISDTDSEPEYQHEHETICKAHGARYIYTKTGRPWNISRARNVGIRQAQGEYVMVTDMDCIFSPNFIETVLKHVATDTIVHCRLSNLPESYGGALDDWKAMTEAAELCPPWCYGACQVVDRAWAESICGYDEEYELWGAEDTDFMERARTCGRRLIWVEKEASLYHQWHSQTNRSANPEQLKLNRARLEMTKNKRLPIVRNPEGWGEIPKSNDGDDTAIIITTFLRDEMLFRCIESIRQYYPSIPIYVGDNGYKTDAKVDFCNKHHCAYIEVPFDVGVGETRNAVMRQLPEKYRYIVIVEDDIIFTERTKLETWRAILDAEPEVGIVGGLLMRDMLKEQHYEASCRIEGDTHYIEKVASPEWKTLGGIRYFFCDLILNVFMMRRETWEAVKWDPQFETAPEHSDYFLRLKYETDEGGMPVFDKRGKPRLRMQPIKVAYAPDVMMHHKRIEKDARYLQYRTRQTGLELFAQKWGIEFVVSSFNRINPTRYKGRGMGYSEKDENLGLAIKIFERHKCKWWLEAGTCLGAIREHDFIGHDPDMDVSLTEDSLPLWDTLIEEFKAAGFTVYKQWLHEKKRVELSFKRKGVKLDIYFYFRAGNLVWHGAFGPDDKGRWGKHMVFLPHVFSARYFDDLKEMIFRGRRVFVPNPPEDYLTEQYGPTWRTPKVDYKYWEECRAIWPNFFSKKKKTVFVGGVWDLFHVGHLNLLERARIFGHKLVVGILDDEVTIEHKPRPVIPIEQRKRILEALSIVDEVVIHDNIDILTWAKANGRKIDCMVHGDDWDTYPGEDEILKQGGKMLYLPYTEGISTTEIREKLMEKKHVTVSAAPSKTERIAIGIKTFRRESALFRCLDAIKKNCQFPYRLYIADDGPTSEEKDWRYKQLENEGHEIIRLPYNVGLSAGRNAIVKRTEEDMVLIMDDDILLLENDSLKKMMDALKSKPDIGLVAGILEQEFLDQPENPVYIGGNGDYVQGLRFEHNGMLLFRMPSQSPVVQENGYRYRFADQVVNFFLARTQALRDIRWDDRIKIQWEHLDFFLRMKKTKWRAAVCLDTCAYHMRKLENDPAYNQARQSGVSQYFYQKHGIHNVINRYQ